jgi:hypothetical protein
MTTNRPDVPGTDAEAAPAPSKPTWSMQPAPDDPAKTSQVHIVMHADPPKNVRVCYTTGPADSFIAVRANTKGSPVTVSNLNKDSCLDVGGSDIELTNPNSERVTGTYEVLPPAEKAAEKK